MIKIRKLWLWIASGALVGGAVFGTYIHSKLEKQWVVVTATRTLNLEEAIREYYSHYNKLPDTGSSDFTMDSPAGQQLLAALMGDGRPGYAARSIRFLPTPRPMKSLDPTEEIITRATTDAWGLPFRVILDDDFDQRITINLGHGKIEVSGVHALVLSRGRDGIEWTSDDIRSWTLKP